MVGSEAPVDLVSRVLSWVVMPKQQQHNVACHYRELRTIGPDGC